MNKLEIPEGEKSPFILFDPDKNRFEIKGRSFPEHAEEFYKPVLDWLDGFLPSLAAPAQFHINLYYLNSASLVTIKSVLNKLKKFIESGKAIEIIWHYDKDDNDIKRTGEDYMYLLEIPLSLVANPEED